MAGFKPGDLICVSKPFSYVLFDEIRGQRCDYCFSKHEELKKCAQCSFMFYCNKDCQVSSWEEIHKWECKLIKKAGPHVPSYPLRMIANVLLKVKKFGYDKPVEVVYGHEMTFRRLMSHANEVKSDGTWEEMAAIIDTIKQYIGGYCFPAPSEFVEIFGKISVNEFTIQEHDEFRGIGNGLFLGASIFDHSCEPDAEVVFNGTNMCIRAVKNIPHTDVTKIAICYAEQLKLRKDRQDFLQEKYYFICQCPRCTLSYHEDLMTETIVDKKASKAQVYKFKSDLDKINQMIEDEVEAAKISAACLKVLKEQEGVLGNSHICRVQTLEIAFFAFSAKCQWANVAEIGKQLIEPYMLIYGLYHPKTGLHFLKIGKAEMREALFESAKIYLLQAEESLKVTHGTDHPVYEELCKRIVECEKNIDMSE